MQSYDILVYATLLDFASGDWERDCKYYGCERSLFLASEVERGVKYKDRALVMKIIAHMNVVMYVF